MIPHQVLVVDDEPLMCRSLSTTIQRLGYEATSVGSGREALRQLERSPSRLIFSDMRMPGMDGLEFLRRVKAVRPEILVIVMTAYGSVETAIQAMKE
ncbi:MAG: response regulator, partial [candidate division NC10 bacterium]